jgi:hypothetical protein
MPDGTPYGQREDDEARSMREAVEELRELPGVPRPLVAGVSHALYAAATELSNGRPLAIEVRRAATHLVRAIGESKRRPEGR